MSLPPRHSLLAALAVFTGLALAAPVMGAIEEPAANWSASTGGSSAEGSTHTTTTTVLVGFATGGSLANADLPLSDVVRNIPQIGVVEIRVKDPSALEARLARNPAVSFVVQNQPLSLSGTSWDGSAWDGSAWDASSSDGSAWDGSAWDGSAWDGSAWDGSAWDGASWDGSAWDGSAWDGSSWNGAMDPGFPHQWGLGAVNAPDAWQHTVGTRSVTICVLDTGTDPHKDLWPNLMRNADGTFGYNAMTASNGAPDDVGHGTHVAGIIAAVGGNGTGITGLAQQLVLPVKVMDKNGGTEADLAAGIVHCADQGARVISMSLHVTEQSDALDRAIKYAYDKGVLMVAASGNDRKSTSNYPAASEHVVSVGAVKPDATVASFSNGGADLVAPGVWIASTYLNHSYVSGSGTSQATPWVAATASLMWDMNPALTAADVKLILTTTARDIGPLGSDEESGAGALDAGAAVGKAAALALQLV